MEDVELKKVKFLRDEAWKLATASRYTQDIHLRAMSAFAELQRLYMDMQKSN